MMNAAVEQDEADVILEDYRATVRELRGNVERLKELVEEQILLETPPRLREPHISGSDHSPSSSQTE